MQLQHCIFDLARCVLLPQLADIQESVSRILRDIPKEETDLSSPEKAEAARFLEHLTTSVRKRVDNIPDPASPSIARVAILFSGGIDCTVLAYIVHRCLPPTEPIELINIAFEQPKTKGKATAYDVPDRLSGRDATTELRTACPGREFRFVEVDITLDESKARRQQVVDLMYPSNSEMDLVSFTPKRHLPSLSPTRSTLPPGASGTSMANPTTSPRRFTSPALESTSTSPSSQLTTDN